MITTLSMNQKRIFFKKMEDLSLTMMGERDAIDPPRLPSLIQYGIKLPFRVAIVGQTNSGKCIRSSSNGWVVKYLFGIM